MPENLTAPQVKFTLFFLMFNYLIINIKYWVIDAEVRFVIFHMCISGNKSDIDGDIHIYTHTSPS